MYSFGNMIDSSYPLREKSPYLELFWSVFSRIRTEYGEILQRSLRGSRKAPNKDTFRILFTHRPLHMYFVYIQKSQMTNLYLCRQTIFNWRPKRLNSMATSILLVLFYPLRRFVQTSQ